MTRGSGNREVHLRAFKTLSEFLSDQLSSLRNPFLLGAYPSVLISQYSCCPQRLCGQLRNTGLGGQELDIMVSS